jgi:hypothetical protein
MDTYEFLEDENFLNLRCIFSKYFQLGAEVHHMDIMNGSGEERWFSFCVALAWLLHLSLSAVWKLWNSVH